MKTNNCQLIIMRFFRLFYGFCSIMMLCLIFSCAGEEEPYTLQGDKYNIDDLTGTWTATQAFFSSLEEPNKGNLDVIDEGGSLTLKIESDGRFRVTIVLPGEPNMVFTGQLGFDEEWLAMAYDDEPEEYYYHYFDLNADKSELTIRGDGYIDLDGDGVEDMVSMSFVLLKN